MHHVAAFGKTSGGLGAGTYDGLTAKTDIWLATNQAGQFFIGGQQISNDSGWRIEWGYAMGTTMSLARIFAGGLQKVGFPSITPINPGLTIPSAFEVVQFGGRGPMLQTADAFQVQSDSTAAEVQTAFLGLHDGNFNLPFGDRYTLQFSTTITTVANAWTAGSIALTQNPPPGKYSVIGMDILGTTCIAARLVPTMGGPRPGCLGRAANTVFTANQFRNGNLGTWLEFESYVLPTIEVFASSAASIVFTGQMDVVKVR